MTEKKSRPPKARGREELGNALSMERDAFIQTFFKKGAQLTEELLREIEKLRSRNSELEAENARIRNQLRSDDAIRELLRTIEALEAEKTQLLSRFAEVEKRSDGLTSTYEEVETELSNIASLYVASKQLHSDLTPRSVLRQIREMLEQLLGARSYALYFQSDDASRLVPVIWEGVERQQLKELRPGEGPSGVAYQQGVSSICDGGDTSQCTLQDPAANIPLRLNGQVIGVFALFATFEQKTRFLPVDFEFFQLLASQAAAAVVAARLFVQADENAPSLEAFFDLGV